jgi:hypothetical protein
MGKLTHAHVTMPIAADGYIHLGNGDVITPDALVEALNKSKNVEPGTVIEFKHEVQWIHHLDEAMAKVIAEEAGTGRASIGVIEESFLPPQPVDRKTVDL